MFDRKYIFQTIMFGIYSLNFSGVDFLGEVCINILINL